MNILEFCLSDININDYNNTASRISNLPGKSNLRGLRLLPTASNEIATFGDQVCILIYLFFYFLNYCYVWS